MKITTKEVKHIAELIQYAAPTAEKWDVRIGQSLLSNKRTVQIIAEYSDGSRESFECPLGA